MDVTSAVVSIGVIIATALFLHAMSPQHTVWIGGFAGASVLMVAASFSLFTVGTVPTSPRISAPPAVERSLAQQQHGAARSAWEDALSSSSPVRRSYGARRPRQSGTPRSVRQPLVAQSPRRRPRPGDPGRVEEQLRDIAMRTEMLDKKITAAIEASAEDASAWRDGAGGLESIVAEFQELAKQDQALQRSMQQSFSAQQDTVAREIGKLVQSHDDFQRKQAEQTTNVLQQVRQRVDEEKKFIKQARALLRDITTIEHQVTNATEGLERSQRKAINGVSKAVGNLTWTAGKKAEELLEEMATKGNESTDAAIGALKVEQQNALRRIEESGKKSTNNALGALQTEERRVLKVVADEANTNSAQQEAAAGALLAQARSIESLNTKLRATMDEREATRVEQEQLAQQRYEKIVQAQTDAIGFLQAHFDDVVAKLNHAETNRDAEGADVGALAKYVQSAMENLQSGDLSGRLENTRKFAQSAAAGIEELKKLIPSNDLTEIQRDYAVLIEQLQNFQTASQTQGDESLQLKDIKTTLQSIRDDLELLKQAPLAVPPVATAGSKQAVAEDPAASPTDATEGTAQAAQGSFGASALGATTGSEQAVAANAAASPPDATEATAQAAQGSSAASAESEQVVAQNPAAPQTDPTGVTAQAVQGSSAASALGATAGSEQAVAEHPAASPTDATEGSDETPRRGKVQMPNLEPQSFVKPEVEKKSVASRSNYAAYVRHFVMGSSDDAEMLAGIARYEGIQNRTPTDDEVIAFLKKYATTYPGVSTRFIFNAVDSDERDRLRSLFPSAVNAFDSLVTAASNKNEGDKDAIVADLKAQEFTDGNLYDATQERVQYEITKRLQDEIVRKTFFPTFDALITAANILDVSPNANHYATLALKMHRPTSNPTAQAQFLSNREVKPDRRPMGTIENDDTGSASAGGFTPPVPS